MLLCCPIPACVLRPGLKLPRLCAMLLFLLLAGCSLLESAPEQPKKENPTGRSGKHNPNAERLYGQARVLWGSAEICSDPEQAVLYLDEAIRLDPAYADAFLRRGMALSELGQAEEAFEDITRSIRLNPIADAYAYRGLVLLRQGDIQAALEDMNVAIHLAPDAHRAWNFRGAAYLKKGDSKEACTNFAAGCERGDCSFLEKARQENICPQK